MSILGVANPAVTPTNLLYNVLAIPGALTGFARPAARAGRLVRLLLLGTVPGVVIGAVLRVEVLPGPHAFYFVIAAVLAPLGGWLAVDPPVRSVRGPRTPPSGPLLTTLALAVGVVGGIYGIGGGSILAPALAVLGMSLFELAPAALATTFVTSIVGILAFAVLSIDRSGSIAPDWAVGAALGVGGFAGSFLGARIQPRVPERTIRRGLGLLSVALAIRYAILGLT